MFFILRTYNTTRWIYRYRTQTKLSTHVFQQQARTPQCHRGEMRQTPVPENLQRRNSLPSSLATQDHSKSYSLHPVTAGFCAEVCKPTELGHDPAFIIPRAAVGPGLGVHPTRLRRSSQKVWLVGSVPLFFGGEDTDY